MSLSLLLPPLHSVSLPCLCPHVNVRSCLMFNLASCYAPHRSFCLVDNYVTFKGRLGDEWLGEWMNECSRSVACQSCLFPCLNPLLGFPKLYFHSWLLQETRANLKRLALLVVVSWYVWVKVIYTATSSLWLFERNLCEQCLFSFFTNSCCHSMLWMRENLRWTWSRQVWELRYIFMICEWWLPCSLIDWFPTCMMTCRLRWQSRHLGLLDCST